MRNDFIECDVAVIGGGMGGVAAALAAAEAGASVVLSEVTDWLGGQMTSQGVSALDEHAHIESFGGTRSYYRLRDGIRARYQEIYDAPATMPDGAPLNPGNGWVSHLCFEPRIGLQVIQEMLAPHVEAGGLKILLENVPVAAEVRGDRVTEVTVRSESGAERRIRAQVFLDATELGDVLPLTGTEYVTGAEAQSDTGEPHADPTGPHPGEVQGFTYCFAVEHRPGEDHTIPKPEGYERFRDGQPYTFTLKAQDGTPRPFKVFSISPEGHLPFWTYRRIRHGALLDPIGALTDLVLINWPGNDFHSANLIDEEPDEQARILDEAKRLALGFLYWLQTEAPRDDGKGYGYPGLCLRPDVMGTEDGLSKAPYIRESRRILALKRIVEGEVAAAGQKGARAEPFDDSVGVGWYHLDLHDCVGNPRTLFEPTLPFQIPLGALIPRRVINLLAACRNIGTTHITNGAYRLHPVEWNIGESAGALAVFCCQERCSPHKVHDDQSLLRRFQYRLVQRGVPLTWAVDVPEAHPLFIPTQMLIVAGAIPPGSERFRSLEAKPDEALAPDETVGLLRAGQSLVGIPFVECDDQPTWADMCRIIAPHIKRALGGPE
jgi:hypothetical protein